MTVACCAKRIEFLRSNCYPVNRYIRSDLCVCARHISNTNTHIKQNEFRCAVEVNQIDDLFAIGNSIFVFILFGALLMWRERAHKTL